MNKQERARKIYRSNGYGSTPAAAVEAAAAIILIPLEQKLYHLTANLMH